MHFDARLMTPEAVGHRALAANLSDIAAMGARPLLATIALGVPPGFEPAWILAAYRAMAALAARTGCAIVGGDVVRAPALFLSISVVGEVAAPDVRLRTAGRPGDVVAVTGALGASRAGLELLRRPELAAGLAPAAIAAARDAFGFPEPRLREGDWLASSAHVRAMMDLSDGLSTDLARLATSSGCGAVVDDVPVAEAARSVAAAAGAEAERYALDGGEDFELLVTIAPRAFGYLAARFRTRFGRPLIAVGRLVREPGLRRTSDGAEHPLDPAGFSHLEAARD